MNGVLVLDKPEGPTSFDMVARVRRAAGERRVGHAGTLDPMATGVLLCCLGEATKLVPFLMDADKEYRATMLLGVSTDSDDAGEGAKVIARADPAPLAELSDAAGRGALLAERGSRLQRPPAFSALKVGGEPLYERARAGEDLAAELAGQERTVSIHEILIEQVALPRVTFTVRCGTGTYIRAIARDVGQALGVGAHLVALRRLRVGRFTVDDATPLGGDADRRQDRLLGEPRLFAPAAALAHLPAARLDEALAARVRDGLKAAVAEAAEQLGGADGPYAVALGPRGELIAVLTRREDRWTIARGFRDAA